MQNLSRWISGGSLKNKSTASSEAPLATSPNKGDTGYLGPPLTAAQSRKILEEDAKNGPALGGHPPVKPQERRGSWHEGTEFLGV